MRWTPVGQRRLANTGDYEMCPTAEAERLTCALGRAGMMHILLSMPYFAMYVSKKIGYELKLHATSLTVLDQAVMVTLA